MRFFSGKKKKRKKKQQNIQFADEVFRVGLPAPDAAAEATETDDGQQCGKQHPCAQGGQRHQHYRNDVGAERPLPENQNGSNGQAPRQCLLKQTGKGVIPAEKCAGVRTGGFGQQTTVQCHQCPLQTGRQFHCGRCPLCGVSIEQETAPDTILLGVAYAAEPEKVISGFDKIRCTLTGVCFIIEQCKELL
jgi:hypothetical protein